MASRKISLKIKLRLFKVYVESIMLYNSEIWTIKSNMIKEIDSFQRRLLRYVLNIKFPEKISNEALKDKIKFEQWSLTIRRKRIKWIGHMFRLPEGTAATDAIKLAERETKYRRGRRIITWIDVVKKDLEIIGLSWDEAKTIALDQKTWQDLVNRIM